MRKIVLVFGVLTLLSGLFLVFFSEAIVPTRSYEQVTELRYIDPGQSESIPLRYKPSRPTSNMTVDVLIAVHNRTGTGPITVRLRGAEIDKKITLENWFVCRFEDLPPLQSGSLIAYVHNDLSEEDRYIIVYFIIRYEAKDTTELFYAGIYLTIVGVIELGTFTKLRSAPSSVKSRAEENKTNVRRYTNTL